MVPEKIISKVEKKSLDPKKIISKLPLFPILMGLVIIVASLVFLRPKIVDIWQLNQNISQKEEKLAQLTQKAVVLESLNEVELATKKGLALEALPILKDVPMTLSVLKSLGSQAEVTFKAFKINPDPVAGSASPEEQSELPSLGFEIVVEAELGKIRNFLSRIESALPLMRVKVITIDSAVDSEGNFPFKATLDCQVFFLPLPTSSGNVEVPVTLLSDDEEKAYQTLVEFQSFPRSEDWEMFPTGRENPFESQTPPIPSPSP